MKLQVVTSTGVLDVNEEDIVISAYHSRKHEDSYFRLQLRDIETNHGCTYPITSQEYSRLFAILSRT